jgi:hypothetical protein
MNRTIYHKGVLKLDVAEASTGAKVGILTLDGGLMVLPLAALQRLLAGLASAASAELGLESTRVEGPAGAIRSGDGEIAWHIDAAPGHTPMVHFEVPGIHCHGPLEVWARECVNWLAIAQDLRKKERHT